MPQKAIAPASPNVIRVLLEASREETGRIRGRPTSMAHAPARAPAMNQKDVPMAANVVVPSHWIKATEEISDDSPCSRNASHFTDDAVAI